MVASLGLSTYSVVKVGINSCGSVQNFAYSESIHPELKQTLLQDVIKPNGCNQCSDKNHVPIWLAPGDMCDMQQTYGRLTYHPKFQHCHIANYATDFNPTDHVKACVTKEDVRYLWESGHCRSNTSLPFFDSMKEGLLFCKKNCAAIYDILLSKSSPIISSIMKLFNCPVPLPPPHAPPPPLPSPSPPQKPPAQCSCIDAESIICKTGYCIGGAEQWCKYDEYTISEYAPPTCKWQ